MPHSPQDATTSPAEPAHGLLGSLRRNAGPEAFTESQPDPTRPGRSVYRIVGPTAASVQAAIIRAMDLAETHGGHAQFTMPIRLDGGFGAVGYVVLAPQ